MKILIIGLFCVVCCAGCFSEGLPDLPPGDLPELIGESDAQQTEVHGHLGGTIRPGKNCVYCGTLQLLWNELQDNITKTPIRSEGGSSIADYLNRRTFCADDLSPDSYFVSAYTNGDNSGEKKLAKFRERFPDAKIPPIALDSPNEILGLAYLTKTLPFEHKFKLYNEDSLDFKQLKFNTPDGPVRVASFGIWGVNYFYELDGFLSNQISILDYKNDDDFVLKLISTSAEDEIILAKVSPEATIGATVDKVERRIAHSKLSEKEKYLEKEASVMLPVIDLDITSTYPQLGDVIQGIDFRLDEKGARLESYAAWLALEDVPPPRQFIFDKPFLLYLKQKKSRVPYLAVWIENTELLEPLKAPDTFEKESQDPASKETSE